MEKERKLKNDPYDEAVDISQSFDQMAVAAAAAKKGAHQGFDDKDAKGLKKGNEQSKSQSVINKPFDEALEFSHSGSDESVDTRASQKNQKRETLQPEFKPIVQTSSNKNTTQLAPQTESKKPVQQQSPQVT